VVVGADEAGVLVVFWPRPPNKGLGASVDGVVDGVVVGFKFRPPNSGFWVSEFVVVAGLVVCDVSPGLFQLNEGSGCFPLSPPKRPLLGAGD
jgi:hypothetical protein